MVAFNNKEAATPVQRGSDHNRLQYSKNCISEYSVIRQDLQRECLVNDLGAWHQGWVRRQIKFGPELTLYIVGMVFQEGRGQ